MLSVAELSTAMPRSGGAYFFVERALGPSAGTVAGIGTWLSLVLKDAFALVGMSAYLHLVFDVPNTLLAVVLIIGFTILNIVGAKNSASLQLLLVAFVLLVLGWFFIAGLDNVASDTDNLSPFFKEALAEFSPWSAWSSSPTVASPRLPASRKRSRTRPERFRSE